MFPKFIAISSIMVALQAEHHLNRRSSFTGNSIMQYYSSQNCKKSENWQLIKLQTIRISWKCKITFLNGISMFSKLCLYVYLEIIQKLGKISKYYLYGNTCSPSSDLVDTSFADRVQSLGAFSPPAEQSQFMEMAKVSLSR